MLLHRLGIQPVVDVDDADARVLRALEHRHQPQRVPGRDDDGIHLRPDQLLDDLDLLLDGGLLRGRLDEQLDAQLLLGAAGAPLHLDEERVGERLHHQRHLPDRGAGGGLAPGFFEGATTPGTVGLPESLHAASPTARTRSHHTHRVKRKAVSPRRRGCRALSRGGDDSTPPPC